jgi:hypothetical protein
MLIALVLGWLLLGRSGGSELWFFGDRTPQQMNKEIAKVAPDSITRGAADYTLEMIEKESKSLQSERSKLARDVLAALENHDTSAAQFQALEARGDAINSGAGKTMLDLRFILRSQLSDAQWRTLFPPSPASPSK